MEEINKNPIQAPDITGDLNKLNQVANQPDLSVSTSKDKQWGIPSTEEILKTINSNKTTKETKSDPFLDTIKAAGFDSSTNTMIRSGIDLSKYKDYVSNTGFGISTPIDLLDSERAKNQSNWEQAFHAVGRVAGNIVPEIGQQLSRTLDWSGDYSDDNAVSEYFQDIKDNVNEALPIFRENPNQAFNFGDFAYWMDQGSNIATSALAFAALGYATGGVASMGFEGLGALGARVLPNAIRSATGARIAKYVKEAGSAVLTSKALTHAESVGVAIDTYNEKYEKALASAKQSGMTDSEAVLDAKTKASQAASFAYNMNQINFFLNLSSAFKFNSLGRLGSRGALATDGATGALNTSKESIKKALLKEGADLGLEAGQEYTEETINFVAQKRAVDNGANESWSEVLRKSIEDAKSTEGLEAGFWGAFGGIAQTGATGAGKYIPMYKNKAYTEAYTYEQGRLTQENLDGKNDLSRKEIIEEAKKVAEQKAGKANARVSQHYISNFREQQLIDSRNKILSQFGMVATEDATSAEFTEETGKNVKDAVNLMDSIEEQARVFDEYDDAIANNDIERAEEIRERFSTTQMMSAINDGTANTLERVYQSMANLTGAQAVAAGLVESESDLSYKTNAEAAIKKLKKLETANVRNSKFVNKDTINEIDADLIELTDSYNRRLKTGLEGIIPMADDSDVVNLTNLRGETRFFYKNASDANINTDKEYQKGIKQKLAEAKELYNIALSQDEQRQRNLLLGSLSTIEKRIENLKTLKDNLTSKPTQKILKNIMRAARESEMIMANNIKLAQEEEKRKQEQKNKANASNPKATNVEANKKADVRDPDTSEPVTTVEQPSTPPLAVSPQTTEVVQESNPKTEENTDSSEEVIEISSTPTTTSSTVDIFDLSNNPSLSAIVNILGEESLFVNSYTRFITEQLEILRKRQEGVDVFALLDKIITTFEDRIVVDIITQNALFSKYPDIAESTSFNIVSLVNVFLRSEIERFNAIKSTLSELNTSISDLANTQEAESSLTDDEKSESFDSDFDDFDDFDDVFDIDADIAQRTPSPLDFKGTMQIATTVSSILNDLADRGIPIYTWDDFYIQLVNASSKDVVNSILPRLKNLWNFIEQDNKAAGNTVNETDYQIDESVEHLDELAEKAVMNEGWSAEKDGELVNALGNVINDIASSTPTSEPVLVKTGTGLKATSVFKIAYLAREYVTKVVMKDGIRIDTKQDFDDSLNKNNDYQLYDTANLVEGTELVLIPLNIGETYTYVDPKSGNDVVIKRVNVDSVSRSINNGTPEIVSAVEHMPIFISTSTNRRDIIDNAFLHLPSWITFDSMAENVDLEAEQEMLRNFRSNVIYNVNKKGKNKALVRIKIANKTAGIPITSPSSTPGKTSQRITENISFAVNTDGTLVTGRETKASYTNTGANALPNATVYALLPTPIGNVAYPLRKTTFKNTNLKDSVLGVLDLLFTAENELTNKQKQDIDTFKRLGLNVRSASAVKRYLNDILYTGHLRNADSSNKALFFDTVSNTKSKYVGKPLFRFDISTTPYLQFGRVGTEGSELNHETYNNNKEEIVNLLSSILDNTYINTNVDNINSKKKIIGYNNGTPSILYNSYNDFIKDTTLTNLSPKVVTNPKTGKDKTIYTFQQTIALERPIVNAVSEEGVVTPLVEPVVDDIIEEPIDTKEPDFIDPFEDDFFDDGEGYSFDTAKADDEEEGYTFEKAMSPYTYIPGISNLVQNSVIFDIINGVYGSIIERGTPMSVQSSFDSTIAKIKEFKTLKEQTHTTKLNKGLYKTDSDREKAETELARLNRVVPLLESNKDKIIKRVNLLVKQEGLVVNLSGKAKKVYLEKIAKQRELNQEKEEIEDLGLDDVKSDEEVQLLLEVGDHVDPDHIDESTENPNDELEITDEMSFDKDAQTINPASSLTQELKQFFNNIKQTRYVLNPKTNTYAFVNPKNFLGLYNTIPFNTVFQKIQELLAQYPTENYKNPDIKTFIRILEDNKTRAPYLNDVVEKLKSPDTTDAFKNAFVLGMYKMYNNTIFTNIKPNKVTDEREEEEGDTFVADIVSVTDNNAVSLLMNKWNAQLEEQGTFEEHLDSNGELIRTMNPIVRNSLQNLFSGIKSSKTAMMDFVKVFKSIGVTFPIQMLNDLGNGVLKVGDDYYGLREFVDLPMVKYAVTSIIGNSFAGTTGITDANTEDVYGNSAFLRLAKLIATYEDNLTSNSSRNLNGDVIFNISEMKNLVESFFSAKDISKLINQMSDPYHSFVYNANKRLKSWRESLMLKVGDSFIFNDKSNFASSHRYYTLSGQKVKDSNGSTVLDIEKMSENDHILNHILMFINNGKTIGSGNNIQPLAIFPFLTMSDKKIPMAFSAPVVNFITDIFVGKQESLPMEKRVRAQEEIDYLYEVLLLPDINRMLYLANNPSINIKEYSKENAKFYTLPSLNLIDFDYVDGDIDNEYDPDNQLRKDLNLAKGENLFKIEGVGSSRERIINPSVLQKPEVIAFLKKKMLENIRQEATATKEQMITAGLLIQEDNSLIFNEQSKLNFKGLKKLGYKQNSQEFVQKFILNYTANKILSYAQMQDLYVGDPIQYAKPSKDTKTIKGKYQDNINTNVNIQLSLNDNTVTEKQAEQKREDIRRKDMELDIEFIKATGTQDVLSANDNQGKRLASDNASGQLPVYDKDNQFYNLLVMKDVNVGVSDIDFYIKQLVPLHIQHMEEGEEKDRLMSNFIGKYEEIDQADAQELVTLKEHLDTMVALQELSREEADAMLKDDENGNLDITKYSNILQSMKMVYAYKFNRNGIDSKLYVKSSSFPLSKTFTKGLPIAELYNYMSNPANNVHRAAFKTAVKVGGPVEVASIFAKDGTIIKDAFKSAEKSVIRSIPRAGLKKQQNVPYKESKDDINDGTQKAKSIFTNLMETPGFIYKGATYKGRDLYDKYIQAYNNIFRLKAEKLRKKLYPFGINAGIDYTTLHKLIIEEAISRGYSENDIAFLDLREDKKGFKFPLWLSGNEKKLSALLNSIVDNNIRKRKRRGSSAVLVSDITVATNPEYKSNIIYTTMDRGNQLRSMRSSETGEIIEAEVIVPFNFRDEKGNLLNIKDFTKTDADGNMLIDMDKIPADVLDIIGFRIPTQGLNSMLAIKIVGFLPDAYKNVVIAPVDVVAQMGSDFDVDKLFQDYVNTMYEDGKIRKLNDGDLRRYKDYIKYKNTLKRIKEAKKAKDDVRVGILSKELETIRGLLSQKDFLEIGKRIPSDIEIRLLENEIFEMQKAVLMNPHKDVQSQRVQPIDSATFENITKNIMPKVFDSRLPKHWTPYTTLYQIRKYLNARGGKVGVSTWSSTSVLNSVLQGINFLTSPMYFQVFNEDTKKLEIKTYSFMGQQSTAINDPKGHKGHFKSDIIQALQSITVDNENLQIMHKLNLNEHTNDFIRAATLLGFDENSIFMFINHPVVKEIVKGKINKTTINKPNNYYIIKNAEGVEEKRSYSKDNLNAIIATLTEKTLKEDIDNDVMDITSPKDYAIYAFFMELSERGKDLKSVESLLNVDSKGIGSNLFYSIEKEKAIYKLMNTKTITNINKALGEVNAGFISNLDVNSDEYKTERSAFNKARIEEGYVRIGDQWLKPSTIPAMAAGFALITNNSLWTKEFPYTSNSFEHFTREGLALENNKTNDRFYTLTDATKSGKVFINKEVIEDSIGSASPTKDSNIKIEVVEHLKSFLYSSVKNLRTLEDQELVDLLEIMQEKHPNNLFLKKLSIEQIEDTPFIVMESGAKDSGIDNNLVHDIIELIVYDEESSAYMKNLIIQQLQLGGIQKAKQFVKHIPPHYLDYLGIFNDMKNLSKNIDLEQSITQYIQHNPHLVASKELSSQIERGNIKINQESIYLPDANTDPALLQGIRNNFIAVQQSNGVYLLFKRDPVDLSLFRQIPTLGKNGIREYDIDTPIGRSRFVNNNPRENWYLTNESVDISAEDYTKYRSIITTKLAKGVTNPDDADAIVKVCK